MEHSFWHDKWEINQTGFHLDYVHPILKRNLAALSLEEGAKVFVPLCGKTLDIGFLLAQGQTVVAVELSEIAVQAVFEQLGLQPEITDWQGGKRYQTANLTIFAGDFFALTQADLGALALVYDRAAIIALPEEMRRKYASHLAKITNYTSQLLITLDYDQSIAGGPPFAVSTAEVEALYGGMYPIQLIEEADIIEQEPRFKAKGLTSFYQRGYKLK